MTVALSRLQPGIRGSPGATRRTSAAGWASSWSIAAVTSSALRTRRRGSEQLSGEHYAGTLSAVGYESRCHLAVKSCDHAGFHGLTRSIPVYSKSSALRIANVAPIALRFLRTLCVLNDLGPALPVLLYCGEWWAVQ